MIFVTVGVQLPFDRLVKVVDQWADAHPEQKVFAQIGVSSLSPENMQWQKFLEPDQFGEKCRNADLIIGHAGMGSILTALEYGKPLLVMPRRATLGEHRNDHQLATVERFRSLANVHVAMDEAALLEKLNELLRRGDKHEAAPSPQVSPKLIQALRDFVNQA